MGKAGEQLIAQFAIDALVFSQHAARMIEQFSRTSLGDHFGCFAARAGGTAGDVTPAEQGFETAIDAKPKGAGLAPALG